MSKTTIEWATDVWNPTTGCTKVSEGCRHCYAERIAKRFWGERKFTDVLCHEERLNDPLKWRKPRRVFVDSMSDLFHPDVPFSFVERVFFYMRQAPRHTFIILTKRPERMRNWANWGPPPLPNVWLGVSAENQQAADERIPLLLQTPAAVRFVSVEPMLGPVDLDPTCRGFFASTLKQPGIDWVICGGESGPGARPMHPDWVRSLRDQCQVAGVPFFFKQWGEWQTMNEENFANVPQHRDGRNVAVMNYPGFAEKWFVRVGKHTAGRLLDGREWNEYPEAQDDQAS